jgi:hypothetical protein
MASVSSAADKVTIDHDKRSFTIRTKRLVATIRDGVIVNLDNRLTGELLADQHLGENRMPTGLGHLTDNIPAMSSIHHVWGKHASITQGAKGSLPNFHAPCGQSRFTCTYKQNVVVATWHGLHNENTYFPDEMLTITASSDKRGALNYKATATSVQGGVFGVVVPLANINSNAIFYLPSFGGMRLRAAPEPWLRP